MYVPLSLSLSLYYLCVIYYDDGEFVNNKGGEGRVHGRNKGDDKPQAPPPHRQHLRSTLLPRLGHQVRTTSHKSILFNLIGTTIPTVKSPFITTIFVNIVVFFWGLRGTFEKLK